MIANGKGYRNAQHDETPLIYIDRIHRRLGRENTIIKLFEKKVQVKLTGWASVIVYVITHELLHSFGIPHLGPLNGRKDVRLMDRKISFDLFSYWKRGNFSPKIKEEQLLRKLLTPKQKAYLEFILRKEPP